MAIIWTFAGGVAADRRIGAIGDAVAGNEHAARAENIDAVAVLARAAAVGANAHDAVVGDDAAVLAGLRAPNLDAVVGAVDDGVVQDFQSRRVETADACLHGAAVTVQSEMVPAQRSSVMPLATLRDDVQTAQLEPRAVLHAEKRVGLPGIERLVGAVEREVFKNGAVGAIAAEEGCPA